MLYKISYNTSPTCIDRERQENEYVFSKAGQKKSI
jgi:hypothetical protein